LVERARDPNDVPAVKLHKGLIPAFISIDDDSDGMVPDGVTDAVDPGDQDEPAASATCVTEGGVGRRGCALPEPPPSWLPQTPIENNTGT
jgi:hypothetical protein